MAEDQSIYFYGFDKNLNRNVIVKSPLVFDSFETANPSLLTSGPLLGNLTLADGNLQTGNFESGVSGVQMTSTGYLEANEGVFRGNLSIGSGNNIILADPDDATWRLGVGNADISQAPFRVDKDGNAYGIGFKVLESITAGEDIASGNVVCFKNSYDSALIATATYATDLTPDTNYGNATNMYVGSSGGTGTAYVFMKMPTANIPTNFQKAELFVHTIAPLVGDNQVVQVDMASADAGTAWIESNLTWNNKPESFFDSDDPGGAYTFTINASTNDWFSVDITQAIKQWIKSGVRTDYGLRLLITSPTGVINLATDDYTDNTDFKPFLRWLTYDDSDGKVYKAKSTDYNLSRSVIGIATATATAETSCEIQTLGKCSNISSTAGMIHYISSTAGSTNGIPDATRVVKVGVGSATNQMLLNIQSPRLFIETLGPFNIQASNTIHTIVVHPDCSQAVVEYIMNRATTYSAQGNFIIDTFGQTAVEIQNSDQATTNKEFNTTWDSSNQYIAINSESAATSGSDYLTYKIHCYA